MSSANWTISLCRGGRPLLAVAVAALQLLLSATAFANDSTIVENRRAGDVRWQGASGGTRIVAYTPAASVVAGSTLDFYVSTDPVSDYRVEIHRLGWYDGLGGRRVGCFPLNCSSTLPGQTQPTGTPDATGRYVAGWTNPITIPIDPDWASGYYIAEFIRSDEPGQTSGPSMRVPFIVRSPQPHSGSILVQAPTNTWQAYNRYGGRSLYPYDPDGAAGPLPEVPKADRVSYDRPYGSETGVGGTSAVWRYEYQVVKFLEREGYEIEYTTNVDLDRDPASVRAHKLAISVGHDEYWTRNIYDAFRQARDTGVNLIFLSSNTAYWNTRLEEPQANGGLTITGYKERCANDPGNPKSCRMREVLGRPGECNLLGVRWNGGWNATGQYAVPGASEIMDRSYFVTPDGAANAWMRAAGFANGEELPRAVGYEWDSQYPGCRTDAKQLFVHDGPAEGDTDKGWSADNGTPSLDDTRLAHATVYTAPSGARVFSSGSMQFNLFLDPFRRTNPQNVPAQNSKVEALMRAMIDELSTGRAPGPGTPPPPDPDPFQPPFTPPPQPPSQGGDPTVQPPPVDNSDRTAPGLRLSSTRTQRALKRRRVTVKVRCNEACAISVVGKYSGIRFRGPRASTTGAANKTKLVSLPVLRTARAKIKRALRRHKRVTLTLTVTVADASRNTAVKTVKIRLR